MFHLTRGPHREKGINALNAAMLGMMNIHALRETFPDNERVRVHPMLTKGGDIVNIVPADVRMESYVRAASTDYIKKVKQGYNPGSYRRCYGGWRGGGDTGYPGLSASSRYPGPR